MRKKFFGYALFILYVFFSSSISWTGPSEEHSALIAIYNSKKGGNWNNRGLEGKNKETNYNLIIADSYKETNVARGKPVTIKTNGSEDSDDHAEEWPSDITDGRADYQPISLGIEDGCIGWVNNDYNELMIVTVTIDLQGAFNISKIMYNMGNCQRAETWNADIMDSPFARTSTNPGMPYNGAWTKHTGNIIASSVQITFEKTRTAWERDWLFIGEIEVWGIPIVCPGANVSGLPDNPSITLGDSYTPSGAINADSVITDIILSVSKPGGIEDNTTKASPYTTNYSLSELTIDSIILNVPGAYILKVWGKTRSCPNPYEPLGIVTLIVLPNPTYNLTLKSFPDTGVNITVSPNDKNSQGNGSTNFIRTYNPGTTVTITAPSTYIGKNFLKWTVDNVDKTEKTITVTMNSNHTVVVYYEPPPRISVNRASLNFGYIIGGNNLPKESFKIFNGGGGVLNWRVSCDIQDVNLNPISGINSGIIEVTLDPIGLPPGRFDKDIIKVLDPSASNSPVEVHINLWVKKQSESSPPFGEFSTPIDASIVRSSVPVTGWVLGDTGIENVKIYREEGKKLVYIGDAVLVEGARPDVEAAYPDYPMNYKSGWGYMMLTYFLPNGGNGIYKIHAIATDKEGLQTTLGIKEITCDNANAVKPFGAIDTPGQGGTASGSSYINWGWALTPRPNSIPTDGSTINVWVDGINLGNPTYNIYRPDIADFFPGYANSNGAAGYFYLDTTAYENGVHTIQWTVTDNAGNTDGIGSRYFTIQNTGSSASQQPSVMNHWSLGNEALSSIPINHEPVIIRKGCKSNRKIKEIYPDAYGITTIEIIELERVEIQITPGTSESCGYMVVGNQLRPLPSGSTFDQKSGIFCWQPGVGFYGTYEFVFIKVDGTDQRKLKVKILPKHLNPKGGLR